MDAKIERIQKLSDWLITTLKPHPKKEGIYQATVNFSGYSALQGTVADLIKLCALAELSDEPHVSPLVGKGPIDLAGIMELAIQLMPTGESEFLDEVQAVLHDSEPSVLELPEYNYSQIAIVSNDE